MLASSSAVVARIAQRLSQAVGSQRYQMWFGRAAQFEYDDQRQRLQLHVPNQFVADWIGKNFATDIHQAIEMEIGEAVQLDVHVDAQMLDEQSALHSKSVADTGNDRADPMHSHVASASGVLASPGWAHASGGGVAGLSGLASTRQATGPIKPKQHQAYASHHRLRYRLDDFIMGPSNELAYAAAMQFANGQLGHTHTLFIHGQCGLGKTHLLQGICKQFSQTQLRPRVLYITAEQFTNEYLTALRHNRVDGFRKKMRRVDLLAVDDVHFIAGKKATQQEFLHCFNAIDLEGARVVLASDSHPKMIEKLSESLVSRCVHGLVVQINKPDATTRLAIITTLVQRQGLSLGAGVLEVLASRCGGSVREILGTLTKLHALAHLTGQRQLGQNQNVIGHALLNRLFASQTASCAHKVVRFETILQTVSQTFAVMPADVAGRCRHRRLVDARSLVCHLARQLTSKSYPEIAALLGRPNHSTIITANQRIEKQLVAYGSVRLPSQPDPVMWVDLIDQLKHEIIKRS